MKQLIEGKVISPIAQDRFYYLLEGDRVVRYIKDYQKDEEYSFVTKDNKLINIKISSLDVNQKDEFLLLIKDYHNDVR